MQKRFSGLCAALLLAATAVLAADTPAGDRFYGKLTKLDTAAHSLTVHNTRDNIDATFGWTDQTGFIQNRKPVAAGQLQVGQSLVVSYVTEDNRQRATRVTVRPPMKRAKQP